MAQPVEDRLIVRSAENAVSDLLRQGVFFEQVLAVLRDYLRKRNILLLQYGEVWIVSELDNKIPRQRETFPTTAEALTYALELYDKHE